MNKAHRLLLLGLASFPLRISIALLDAWASGAQAAGDADSRAGLAAFVYPGKCCPSALAEAGPPRDL
ncbi:hypothetical protein R5R35_003103 [Gryllus longicercus]|uniref:Accessory gland protein n=1 Tax=Gryllus longicercus TaxID=2509291 RepID=A0AAN9Z6B4_9ORTH